MGQFGKSTRYTPQNVLSAIFDAVNNLIRVSDTATASGGWTSSTLISANTTNATSVKAAAGTVGSISVFNLNASPRYFKLYDKASAPTVGSDTPIRVIMIPGNAAGAGVVATVDAGWQFNTGIAYALVTGIANSDNTAVAANEVIVNLSYA